ncbi:CoA ester lyase [Jiangella asiatica]|uniref:CoA ester lyase n=2 Tax=Jiangella asiatica TaxID=2530372 RepID=A0A4V2Z301_9ACTN|nr:CoA ester lyase [Jiangella asiatica]
MKTDAHRETHPNWQSLAQAPALLAVPGHRPERFEKAARSGADWIMLDLEDAVGPGLKSMARANVERWLASGGEGIVRINSVDTPWHDDDVAALSTWRSAVILPKVSHQSQVSHVLRRLSPGSCILPLLEVSAGILAAREVCSVPGVIRAVFGNIDLASELGIDHADKSALVHARSEVVLASAAAGIAPPIDGITTTIADEDAVVSDARHAAAIGFTGKLCVHPRQVAAVQAVFAPSAEELKRAEKIVSASKDGSVAVLDGELIGKPIIDRARRMLAYPGSARNVD